MEACRFKMHMTDTVQPLRVVQPDAVCVILGARLLIFHMGTWGFSLGEAKQRNLYTS